MHEPQEELLQPIEEEQQGIDLHTAYRVLIRAFYRLECTEKDAKEADHA
jgi:hypothetical protein